MSAKTLTLFPSTRFPLGYKKQTYLLLQVNSYESDIDFRQLIQKITYDCFGIVHNFLIYFSVKNVWFLPKNNCHWLRDQLLWSLIVLVENKKKEKSFRPNLSVMITSNLVIKECRALVEIEAIILESIHGVNRQLSWKLTCSR